MRYNVSLRELISYVPPLRVVVVLQLDRTAFRDSGHVDVDVLVQVVFLAPSFAHLNTLPDRGWPAVTPV